MCTQKDQLSKILFFCLLIVSKLFFHEVQFNQLVYSDVLRPQVPLLVYYIAQSMALDFEKYLKPYHKNISSSDSTPIINNLTQRDYDESLNMYLL